MRRCVRRPGFHRSWNGHRRGSPKRSRTFTDDRGVYRAYGLSPGSYVVSVGPQDPLGGVPLIDEMERSVVTYHPASTCETAVEVRIGEVAEATGVDIRHLGESGNVVNGTVTGIPPNDFARVTLVAMPSRTSVAQAFLLQDDLFSSRRRRTS